MRHVPPRLADSRVRLEDYGIRGMHLAYDLLEGYRALVLVDALPSRSGHAAIKAWKLDASSKYSYASEPIGLEEEDGGYVVTSRVSGNFPGSPVDLRFAFRLERGKIAFLEIAP